MKNNGKMILIFTMAYVVTLRIKDIHTIPAYRTHERSSSNEEFIKRYLAVATTRNYASVESRSSGRKTRGLLKKEHKWPKGVVSYLIRKEGKGSFEPNGTSYNLIKDSMKDIEKISCVQFKEIQFSDTKTLEKFLIILEAGDSPCRTVSPGNGLGSASVVFLKESVGDDNCINKPNIIHELLHVLGFIHEHQREDRDKYIKILFQNIKKDGASSFEIENGLSGTTTLGAKYDRLSIMHYTGKAFSKNNKNTMVWRADESLHLGGTEMSEIDKRQLNTYYNCKDFPQLTAEFKIQKDHSTVKECHDDQCKAKKDGYYPHTDDKHRYVKCNGGKATCSRCSPPSSVFVKRCGICMTSDKGPCKSDLKIKTDCPANLCKKEGKKLNGLVSHRHLKNIYVNCYFGMNFGCYECPNDSEFDRVEKMCTWRPNLNLKH